MVFYSFIFKKLCFSFYSYIYNPSAVNLCVIFPPATLLINYLSNSNSSSSINNGSFLLIIFGGGGVMRGGTALVLRACSWLFTQASFLAGLRNM